MKKILSAILSVMIIASMAVSLTACGGSKSEGGTLTWYVFGDKPQDHDIVMEKANEIIKAEIGMDLDLEYIDSASYEEKMKLKMASGEPYDLAFTGYINPYQKAVDMGGLYDITDLLKEEGFDNTVIPQFYFDVATVKGKIYGIPNVQVVSNPTCIMMDKSLHDEIGADFPAIEKAACNAKTYEDVEKYALMLDELFEKVHKARPDLYVFNPDTDLIKTVRYEDLIGGVSILKDGSTTKLELLRDTKDAQLGIRKVREWYEKGYIRNDIASVGTAITSNEEARKIAVRTATWKPGQEDSLKNKYGEEQVTALIHLPYIYRDMPLKTMTSVGANSKHPREAVKLLKLINTNKELYNLICWGIEGTHYTVNEDGRITVTPDSGYDKIGTNAWKYGNQFNSFVRDSQPEDVWELTEEMNNNAKLSPMLGFVPDTDSIATELSNLTTIEDEYKAKKKFGTAAFEDYFDEKCKKEDEAGIKTVLEELQKQYDEFLASK